MNTTLLELSTTLALGTIGWPQMIVLGLLGVLIFGKRLPEVGKSLGKGIVEFKKGLSGLDTDIDTSTKQLDNATAPPPAASATESHAAGTPADSTSK